jgi:multiple antibiotic resistance protein
LTASDCLSVIPGKMQDVPSMSTALGPAEVFTLFFVTLGPIKLLMPFAKRTRDVPPAAQRQIAVRAFIIATIVIAVGGLIGQRTLEKWHISVPALVVAAGIILFVVALKQVLLQYDPPGSDVDPLPASPMAAAIRLVFPLVITPYGIAAVIMLLAESGDAARTTMILGILVGVMVLDLLAMLFARKLLVGPVVLVLQLLATVLAVLQVALAVQFMLMGWRAIS